YFRPFYRERTSNIRWRARTAIADAPLRGCGLLNCSVEILGYALPLEPLLHAVPEPVPAAGVWHIVRVVREPQVLRATVIRRDLRCGAVAGVAHPGGKRAALRANEDAVVMRRVVLQVDVPAHHSAAVDEVGDRPEVVLERVAVDVGV